MSETAEPAAAPGRAAPSPAVPSPTEEAPEDDPADDRAGGIHRPGRTRTAAPVPRIEVGGRDPVRIVGQALGLLGLGERDRRIRSGRRLGLFHVALRLREPGTCLPPHAVAPVADVVGGMGHARLRGCERRLQRGPLPGQLLLGRPLGREDAVGGRVRLLGALQRSERVRSRGGQDAPGGREAGLGLRERGAERWVSDPALQGGAGGRDVRLGFRDLRLDPSPRLLHRGHEMIDRVEQGPCLRQRGLPGPGGVPGRVRVGGRGRQRRLAARGGCGGEVDPLARLRQVPADGPAARVRVRGEARLGGFGGWQPGRERRRLPGQSRQDLRGTMLKVAQLSEPLSLCADDLAHPSRPGDDLVQHLLPRGRILRDRVVELLADRERGLQLVAGRRERGPERLHVLRAELGLREPQVLHGVAHRVVGLDQELVRLPGQLSGPAVALLGRQVGGPPAADPAADQGHAEHDDDEADQDHQESAARARRGAPGRGAPGGRSAGRRAPLAGRSRHGAARHRPAEAVRERDDSPGIVAGPEPRLER